MGKTKKILIAIIGCVVLFLTYASETVYAYRAQVRTFRSSYVQEKDEKGNLYDSTGIVVGSLRYGFANSIVDSELVSSPDVNYVVPGTTSEVRHQLAYRASSTHAFRKPGYLSNPTTFSLFENDIEYSRKLADGYNDSTANVELKDPIRTSGLILDPLMEDQTKIPYDKNGKYITARGNKITNGDIGINITQFANDKQSAVIHLYTLTNETDQPITVYPMRRVDTELHGFDDVPVYSRGPGEGVYIQSPPSEQPEDLGQKYRLDYYTKGEPIDKTNPEHFPLLYAAANQSGSVNDPLGQKGPFKDVFGPDLNNQGTSKYTDASMSKAEGEEIPIEIKQQEGVTGQTADSGIFMSWGKVVIPAATKDSTGKVVPGTYTMRYDVGITVDTDTEKSKTAKNLTEEYGKDRKDGKNYPDDVIEYSIKYKSKKGSLNAIRFTDVLKDVFDDPTIGYDNQGNPTGVSNIATVTSTKGKSLEFDMSDNDVYNNSTRQLTVPPKTDAGLSVEEGEELTLTFRVKLSNKAANQDVVNIANVDSRTDKNTVVNEDIATETPLPVSESKGKVTIKYQNKNGVQLADPETKEGKIGTNYDFTSGRKEINGYEFESANNSETGTYTSTPKEIIYTYKENSFGIRQEVFDKDGNNADNGTVEMGGLLKYKTTVTSNLKDGTGITYENFTVTANVSPYITVDQSSIKFESASGIQINSVVYDSTTNTITGTIASGAGGIDSSENLILSYEGTVKNVFDVDIVASSTAEGSDPSVAGVYPYSDNKLLASEKPSKPVTTRRGAGNLEFSASSLWDFGSNEIKNEKEEIPLKNVASSNLTVTDNRVPGNDWYLTAQLDKEFTNITSGNVMKNILKYRKAAGDTSTITIPFGSASDILIQGNTSATDRGKAINLASDWGTKNGKGLFLDVPGGLAKKGGYEADITWTLSDTP